jgi:hypothetical protein
MDFNSASSTSAPGYFTPQTQNAGGSAPTSPSREIASSPAPVSLASSKKNDDGKEGMGKRREALNKAKAAKEAVRGAAGKVRQEAGDAARQERTDSRSQRNEQRAT